MSSTFALLGHPVAHSLSPAIHHAAYAALGLSHRYELIDVPDEAALAQAIGRVRSGGLAGVNVTVPWKREALLLADSAAESASAVGAANVLQRSADGRVIAHNTDVPALAREVTAVVTAPRTVLVLGNGGAALGAAAAGRSLGAEVFVSARRFRSSEAEVNWPHAEEFRALGAIAVAWPELSPAPVASEFGAVVRAADVVLQATSAGMHGTSGGAELAAMLPWSTLVHCQLAYDLVYNPPRTEFLRAAEEHGVKAVNGLGMLVGQAALAIELWLGVLPEQAALRAAAEQALAARRPA